MAKLIDEVTRLALVPLLKADGYRKAGRTFRRTAERCVQVVNVQSSQWNTATSISFTVNLGVYYPEVQAVSWLAPFALSAAGPTEAQCQVRKRIGHLSHGRDHWWEISGGDDPVPVVAQVEAAFRDHGRLWLNAMSDFETARRASRLEPLGMAFALAAGDRDEACALAARAVEEYPRGAIVHAWARSLGLIS